LLSVTLAVLIKTLPPGLFQTFRGLTPYAPLVAFLGMAASLSRGSLGPYILGLAAGAGGLVLFRALF
jgi:hypothetical protein